MLIYICISFIPLIPLIWSPSIFAIIFYYVFIKLNTFVHTYIKFVHTYIKSYIQILKLYIIITFFIYIISEHSIWKNVHQTYVQYIHISLCGNYVANLVNVSVSRTRLSVFCFYINIFTMSDIQCLTYNAL